MPPKDTEPGTSSSLRSGLQASAHLRSNVVDVLHDTEDKHISRAAGAFVGSSGGARNERDILSLLLHPLPFLPLSQTGDLSSSCEFPEPG